MTIPERDRPEAQADALQVEVASAVDNYLGIARMANQIFRSHPVFRLKMGLLTAFIAICTYAMNGFTVCHRLLQSASHNTPTDIGKLVPLLLCFPCFQCSHFFFKAAYRCQQGKMLLLSNQCVAIGSNQPRLEFEELRLQGLTVAQAYHRLRDVLQCAEGRNEARNR